MENHIRIYVANLGKYNEGELVGGWIKLPVSDSQLASFLQNTVRLTGKYEECVIHDYEETICSIREYTDISDLNMLACQMQKMNLEQLNKVQGYCISQGCTRPMEVLNICLQADEMPYYFYNFKGIENCGNMEKEELYGYTKAELDGTCTHLREKNLEGYFDFYAYGSDDCLNGAVTLMEDGYADNTVYVDFEKYSRDELIAIVPHRAAHKRIY